MVTASELNTINELLFSLIGWVIDCNRDPLNMPAILEQFYYYPIIIIRLLSAVIKGRSNRLMEHTF